jgi:hypothetical protein
VPDVRHVTAIEIFSAFKKITVFSWGRGVFRVRVSWGKVRSRKDDDFQFLCAGSPNLVQYDVIFDPFFLGLYQFPPAVGNIFCHSGPTFWSESLLSVNIEPLSS